MLDQCFGRESLPLLGQEPLARYLKGFLRLGCGGVLGWSLAGLCEGSVIFAK